jgi:hypothetical protein
MSDRTLTAPFTADEAAGRAFVTPCCTLSIHEFRRGGMLWLVGHVAGHGWTKSWPGSIDDINDTGILVQDGRERRVVYDPRKDRP